MKHSLIVQEKMDGSVLFDLTSEGEGKNKVSLYDRMTINEFKLAYPQVNPNVNIYSIDFDAERRNLFLSIFVFFFPFVFDVYS